MIDEVIIQEAVERVNAVHLLEAEADYLSLRLNDLAGLRDKLAYSGGDPEARIKRIMARRDEILQKLRDERGRKATRDTYDAGDAMLGAVEFAGRATAFDRFDFCAGFSPWVEQLTPNMTEGISETPGVPGTSGEIGTAGLFQGGAAYGGTLDDAGQHDAGDEKFWIHNWRCLIQLPSAPERSTLHYRFGVSSIANIYRAPVMSGRVWVFVTVGTTSDINSPIENWTTVGWPVLATLPAPPPLYFSGDIPVSGKFNVGKGRTAAIGLIFGAIVGVDRGYVQLLWGNFGTHRPVPLTQQISYEDYARIEYRFCPLLVAEWEREARSYFD